MEAKSLFFSILGKGAWVTLNRPHAMNAVNVSLAKALVQHLQESDADPALKYLVIRGEGKAFCSGGDLIYSINSSLENKIELFTTIYKAISLVHNFSKPYISILDGFVMGVGMGISIPGSYRIITENSKLGMPESGIGVFPDVGSAWFLSHCPGKIGLYMGLTGTVIGPQDAIYSGLGTHFVWSQDLDKLFTEMREGNGDNLDEIIKKYSVPYDGKAFLEAHQEIIDSCFNQPSLEKIFQALAHNQSDFAGQTLARLKALSPLSLRTTFDLFKKAENMTMDETLENNLQKVIRWVSVPESQSEVLEGIRAFLVDKDKTPKWPSQPIEY